MPMCFNIECWLEGELFKCALVNIDERLSDLVEPIGASRLTLELGRNVGSGEAHFQSAQGIAVLAHHGLKLGQCHVVLQTQEHGSRRQQKKKYDRPVPRERKYHVVIRRTDPSGELLTRSDCSGGGKGDRWSFPPPLPPKIQENRRSIRTILRPEHFS